MNSNIRTIIYIVEVLVFILIFFAGYYIRKFFGEKHLKEMEEKAKKGWRKPKRNWKTGKRKQSWK